MADDELTVDDWDGFVKPKITNFSTTKALSMDNERESGFDSEEDEEGEADGGKLEEDNSMFLLEEVMLEVQNTFHIRQIVAVNPSFFIATEENQIIHYEDERYRVFDVDIKGDVKIHKIFVDPTGNHLIVSATNGYNFYTNTVNNRNPKVIARMPSMVIDSIGWDTQSITKDSTGLVLIGTSDSCIYEARFENSKEPLKQNSLRLLFDFRDRIDTLVSTGPITGIEVEIYPKKDKNAQAVYLIIVITQFRIFQFIGGPSFQELFDTYKNGGILSYKELPYTSSKRSGFTSSELHINHSMNDNTSTNTFCWLSNSGIFHGSLSFDVREATKDVTAFKECEIIQFDNKSMGAISVAVSEFHTCILYPEKFTILMQPPGLCNSADAEKKSEILQVPISSIKIAYEELLSSKGEPRGLTKDTISKEIFMYTSSSIFRLIVEDETRDVWRLYLEKALDPAISKTEYFEIAQNLCNDNPRKKDMVLTAKADYFFKTGEYDKAADIYAKTTKSFEEIAIAFHNAGQKDALRKFLIYKLRILLANQADQNQDLTQLSCLCTWLTELYLDKVNQLADDIDKSSELRQIQGEFHKFLETYKKHLNRETTFRLISSHGQMEEVIHYATMIEDFERVIGHYITKAEYINALMILEKSCKGKQYNEHFYKFAPILMQMKPKETVPVLIRRSFLEPARLIPAMMRYLSLYNPQSGEENQVIRYLEAVHKDCDDPAIHNLLLSLYAKQEDSTKLLNFIKSGSENGVYDPKYALRVCVENNQTDACIRLYSMMNLYEDAVNLALKSNNIVLAQECAEKPEDEENKKKLWLKIARHVIEKEKNVKKAIEFLNITQHIKLEDILPYFPDFVLIDDFKEEICKSLDEYKGEIERLKQEMADATQNASHIREDINDLKNRYGYITANAKCNADGCYRNILQKDFYLFPCQHMFHTDCLVDEVKKHVSNAKKQRIDDLLRKKKQTQVNQDDAANSNSEFDEMKELDELISAECPFCGEIMINSIDAPFLDKNDNELESWKIGNFKISDEFTD